MYNKPYGDKKKSPYGGKRGGKSFGGPAKSFGGGRDWKPMHPATCEKCGNRCEVPFKPNGSKPVFCSNCFSKDGSYKPKRFSEDRPARPSFSPPSDVSEQLKTINAKLDAIIQAMEE